MKEVKNGANALPLTLKEGVTVPPDAPVTFVDVKNKDEVH